MCALGVVLKDEVVAHTIEYTGHRGSFSIVVRSRRVHQTCQFELSVEEGSKAPVSVSRIRARIGNLTKIFELYSERLFDTRPKIAQM